jgi:hypothetical protein
VASRWYQVQALEKLSQKRYTHHMQSGCRKKWLERCREMTGPRFQASVLQNAARASQKISSTATIEGQDITPLGKTMIPLRLELRTACVLDRSDNQLHHRTIDVKGCFKYVYIVQRRHVSTCANLLPRLCPCPPDDVGHLSRAASRISPGHHMNHIVPTHLCHVVRCFHCESHTDDMFLRHCDQHASVGGRLAPACIEGRSSSITSSQFPARFIYNDFELMI